MDRSVARRGEAAAPPERASWLLRRTPPVLEEADVRRGASSKEQWADAPLHRCRRPAAVVWRGAALRLLRRSSSHLARPCQTAHIGQWRPRPRGDGRRVLMRPESSAHHRMRPGNAPCKNARLPMQSRPGRSGTRAPPTDPQLAPLVTGMSPNQSRGRGAPEGRKR